MIGSVWLNIVLVAYCTSLVGCFKYTQAGRNVSINDNYVRSFREGI